MTTKERFLAAVNVIRNLPKNGSYQPSNSLMLDFYAYYKQATEGYERGSRPAFWDVVGRAKWDAWNRLDKMSKEEAMQRYIDELNKIIETMALTDNVAEFLTSMESYPGNPEDIELSIGPLLERVKSQPGSPVGTHFSYSVPKGSQDSTPSRNADTISSTPSHLSDGDEEDDEFMDTLPDASKEEHPTVRRKDTPMVMPLTNHKPEPPVESKLLNGYTHQRGHISKDPVNTALQRAVECLRKDLAIANEKVKALEERQNMVIKNRGSSRNPMAPGTIAFIVLWPIFIHYFLMWLRRGKQR